MNDFETLKNDFEALKIETSTNKSDMYRMKSDLEVELYTNIDSLNSRTQAEIARLKTDINTLKEINEGLLQKVSQLVNMVNLAQKG